MASCTPQIRARYTDKSICFDAKDHDASEALVWPLKVSNQAGEIGSWTLDNGNVLQEQLLQMQSSTQ